MHRLATSLAALLLASAIPTLAAAQSTTLIGSPNQLLTDGARAMEAGRFQEGLRLTLAGLDQPNPPENAAAGHSNICAAYAYLKRYNEALRAYNTKVRQFPGSIVASFRGFTPNEAYFDAAPVAKEAPKVQF